MALQWDFAAEVEKALDAAGVPVRDDDGFRLPIIDRLRLALADYQPPRGAARSAGWDVCRTEVPGQLSMPLGFVP